MARKWIYASRVEGNASRQAHADMPEGTYEREMSKEGFFGPAAFLHHKRPPTGWVNFEGPLQPRALLHQQRHHLPCRRHLSAAPRPPTSYTPDYVFFAYVLAIALQQK